MPDQLRWTFHSKYEKGQMWYIIAGAIMLGLTLFSFIVGWYMMGVVIIIFCGVYLLFEINSADEVSVIITPEGIQVDGQFFEMAKVRRYGILYVHNNPELLRIVLSKKVSPQLDLKLSPEIPVTQLREYLSVYVVEDEDMDMTFMEHLMHVFRI